MLRGVLALAASLAMLVSAGCGSAVAQPRPGGWQGDVRHFHDHDFGGWQGGHWWHGDHDGRSGWWWMVGPSWYFYPAPVYPHPSPYVPPMIATPQPGYWYYCQTPPGYYPYVPQCLVPWQAVPPQPR
jgi:hypothetical protein